MRTAIPIGYAQARLQAHLARLPDEGDWQRLAATRTLASFIEEARTGGLRDWVKGFSAQSGVPDLERGLRSLARERVLEVADWVPPAWRSAVEWLIWLPLLPLFEHLARGAPAPEWMTHDPTARGLLDTAGEPDRNVLERTGLWSLYGEADPARVADGWLWGWRGRWPAMSHGVRVGLEGLIDLIAGHLARFRTAAPDSAWDLRHALRADLRLRFHQNPLRPTAIFCYLALILLDLERLRAELLRRALFPATPAD